MRKLYFVFSVLILMGCSSGDQSTVILNEPKISLSKTSDITITKDSIKNFSEQIIYETEFIPLETTQEALIGYIDKIVMTDSMIIVADFHKTKKVFVFDKQGNFLRSISNIGSAENEYISIFDITTSPTSNNLFILDGHKNDLLEFSLNGDFIKKIHLPVKYANNIIFENDSICWFERGYRLAGDIKPIENNLIRYDIKNDSITSAFFPFLTNQYLYKSFRKCFNLTDNNKIAYWEQLGNQVYLLSSDSIYQCYDIIGDIPACPAEYKTLKPKEFITKTQSDYFGYVNSVIFLPNWNIISYNAGNSNIQCWVDKTNHKEYIFTNAQITENNKLFVTPDIFKSSDTSICGWLSALAFCNFYPDNHYKINVDSNPVILTYKLEQNDI